MTKQNHNWKCKECGRTIPTIMGGGCLEYQKEEFNLSNKIFWIDNGYSRGGKRNYDKIRSKKDKAGYLSTSRLYVKDVREAVRLLKEELNNAKKMGFKNYNIDELLEEINKIFGKKLI
jgi:hypothetical protein